ncbi:hypothetical protein PPERSA_10625 [Pseudocohnilembus persalinus]|uniref:TmcB/TmcC TPR repeats domain-containing protein n=1 Tax=Pseudocohnilembus persalinus TaxID=266149 RepID=A0A0V0QD31_PSEPJ|nr:hypothetical protein PPERSA_10625 [Pseudocohnilembus persalinus]|eukprot:KRX00126.1 hypothetical protein PPERSA_10625 [Pseudocohnilembus persalinus]
MPVYLSIDSISQFTKEFIVVITLAYLLLIILRYFSAPYYHRNIYNLVIMYEIFCFWISLSVLLHCFLDNGPIDNMGFVFFVVGTPIILKMGVEVFKNKDFSLLNKTYKDIKKDSEFMNYFIVLFDYIEKIEQNYYRIILEGVLRYHNKNCKRTDKCQCQSLLNEKENPNNIQFKWFKFLQQLTEESIEKCPKSNKLLLFHSFLQHDNLENKYKSLYELEKIKDPSLQEQFCIFRYTIIIEEQIIDQDQKSTENQGVDINAIIIFQNEYVKFQDLIESSIVIYLDFWKELIEDNPDIQKLQQLGTEINTKNEQIYNDFLDLSDRNPNHLGALKLYGFYLKSVQNEDKEALLIIEKMFYVMKSVQMNKQFIDNEKVRYDDTSNTTIITISGNKDEMALVKNCNKELEKVLGFHKSYIMDQNISKLMPKIFGEIHNNFVSQFIQSSKEKVIGKSRSVFAEESHGYLVPCKLMIKVFPSLQEGVQIVGFLTKKVFKQIEKQGAAGSNNQHYLIYNVKTFTVAGITKNCYDNYGIPAGLMYGNGANQNEITIDQIFRDLEKQENQDSLMSPQGLITTLDTTEIPRNFLLEDDIDKFASSSNQSQSYPEENQQLINQDGDSIDQQQMNQINEYHQQQENMMNEQNKKQQKYKKVQARVFLESEDTYDNDHIIRVIRFYEVDDQGTNIHENKIKQNSQNKKKTEQKLDHKKQNNTIIEEVEENYQNEMTENQNESIAQSVQQDADQIHDDARNLKEFKQLISEKNVPRQITVLKYLMFFLFIIIISLGVIFQQYTRYQNSDLKKGVLSVYSSYQRLYQISEVNFLSRQMSMIANEYITVSDIEKAFKNEQPNLSDAVDNLQSTNFDVTQYDQDVERSSKNKEYTVYNQLQNGNIKNYEYTFSEAIVSLITSAGTLTNTSYTNFQYEAEIVDGTVIDYDQLRDDGNTVFIDNIQRYYYMVMKNGLFKLRSGARIAADEFYDYYYDRLSTYNTSILIIIIVACVITLGSQIIILPIIFKIYQTNNQVVSLFGNIPIHEIQYLIFKCEFYTDIFFKDQVTDEDDQDGVQKIEWNNEQQNQNNDQQLDNNKTPQGINMINNSFQQNQHENSHSQMINNQNNITTFNTFFNIQEQIKQFLQDKDQEVNFNIIKQNDAICRHKLKELKQIKEEQEKDQEVIYIYDVFIQYNIIFSIEEIILGKVQSDDISDDLQDYYLDQVYDNEGDLLEAYSQYPNDYDSFITQFKSFSQSSLCKVSTYGNENQSDCEDISLGILKSGLRTANIALIENNRNLISNFSVLQLLIQ